MHLKDLFHAVSHTDSKSDSNMKLEPPVWFDCIDGHTCGNPVRIVRSPLPVLEGNSIREKRLSFLKQYDWIRTSLMFEPRGHDMMSGSFIYPPHDPDNDAAILFIETSGCLPMCGHGTIGIITMALEEGLIIPKNEGVLNLEVPAGQIKIEYNKEGAYITSVRIQNVPSYLDQENIPVEVPPLGLLSVDVAYGGNFYAIVDVQKNFSGIENYTADQLISLGNILRDEINKTNKFIHPLYPEINGCSHVLWTGSVVSPSSTARGAVLYGKKAIDRSPCGTGSSARLAQWIAKDRIKVGDRFLHESIIGSVFECEAIQQTMIGDKQGIIPAIKGWARLTGYNKILVDNRDPYSKGFQVV